MAMMTEMKTQGISLRRLTGKDVLGTSRDKIGEVDDVILNPSSGCAMFAVLEEGGFIGIGERHHLVPFAAFSWTADDKLMVQFDRDKLTNAPVFDRSNMPDWGNESWQKSIYDYYGVPFKGMMGGMGGGGQMGGGGGAMGGGGQMGGGGSMGGGGQMGGGGSMGGGAQKGGGGI